MYYNVTYVEENSIISPAQHPASSTNLVYPCTAMLTISDYVLVYY